jgi:transposase-like protein
MAAAPTAEQRAPRRHRSPAEKRRIVELTLRAGSSLRAIASEHGVHPNSLRRWKALYRAGELKAPAQREARVVAAAASATFVPVNVVPAAPKPQSAAQPDAERYDRGVVQIVLGSGASLRFESGALDAALVCALVAELRR